MISTYANQTKRAPPTSNEATSSKRGMNSSSRLDPSSAASNKYEYYDTSDPNSENNNISDNNMISDNSSSSINSDRCTVNLEYSTYPIISPGPSNGVDPMTPERQARKQRLRPGCSRRGGAFHSDLLKSAVLATLESYESSEDEDTPHGIGTTAAAAAGGSNNNDRHDGSMRSRATRRNSSISFADGDALLLSASMNNSNTMDDSSRNSASSRKRARQEHLREVEEEAATTGATTEDDFSSTAKATSRAFLSSSAVGGGMLLVDDRFLAGAMDVCRISSRRSVAAALSPSSPTSSSRHVARRTSKELDCGLVPSPRTSGSGGNVHHVMSN